MNERLTTRSLADILAIQTGLDKEQAEKFISILSTYIINGIKRNKFIKVIGLGTFKIILVNERESVHIQTQERIMIPAHLKLSFIPDRNLKEQVNRPYAYFEPIETTAEIASFKQYVAVNEVEYIDDDPFAPNESMDESVEIEDNIITVDSESEDTFADSVEPETADYFPILEKEEQEPAQEVQKKKKRTVTAPFWLLFIFYPLLAVFGTGLATYAFLSANSNTVKIASNESSLPAVLSDDSEKSNPLPIGAQRSTEENNSIVDSIETATVSLITANVTDTTTITFSPEAVNTPLKTDSIKKTRGTNIDWFANTPENTKTAPNRSSVSTSQKTASTTQQTAQTGNKQTTTPTTTNQASEPKEKTIPASVRLPAGYGLIQLATEYYGDRLMWVYIYEHNKDRINHYDKIPAGTEIRLPSAKMYDFDPNNPASLEKARNKQSELLNWDQRSWDERRIIQ